MYTCMQCTLRLTECSTMKGETGVVVVVWYPSLQLFSFSVSDPVLYLIFSVPFLAAVLVLSPHLILCSEILYTFVLAGEVMLLTPIL